MKHSFVVKEIDKESALKMIQTYHYSNTLPKLNKHFLGFFENEQLKGVITLGWGTRPKHTIKKLFPSLDTEHYLEIGRMCMTDEMERNSESQMLKQCIKWIKAHKPTVKVLFTWADGMLGKCGYVYQASNFIYVGKNLTDIYLKDGYKIHPRQTKKLFSTGGVQDNRVTVRPTVEQMKQHNIEHYRGYQFKYLFFVCGKFAKKTLLKEKLYDVSAPPKDKDLMWQKYNLETKKWERCDIPPYKTDFSSQIKSDDVLNMMRGKQ